MVMELIIISFKNNRYIEVTIWKQREDRIDTSDIKICLILIKIKVITLRKVAILWQYPSVVLKIPLPLPPPKKKKNPTKQNNNKQTKKKKAKTKQLCISFNGHVKIPWMILSTLSLKSGYPLVSQDT